MPQPMKKTKRKKKGKGKKPEPIIRDEIDREELFRLFREEVLPDLRVYDRLRARSMTRCKVFGDGSSGKPPKRRRSR